MPQVPSMYERYILCRKFGAEIHLTGVHGPPGEPQFGEVRGRLRPGQACSLPTFGARARRR